MASYEQLSKYNWKATVSLGYENMYMEFRYTYQKLIIDCVVTM